MFLPSTITLKFGDSGDFVTELQNRLVLTKCLTDGMVTGFYDGATVNAVTTFQGREGLNADGVAGPETLRRLNGVISGSSGSAPTRNQEEEQKIEPTQPIQQFVWGEQPAVNSFIEAAPVAAPEAARVTPMEIAPAPAELRPAQAPQPLQPAQAPIIDMLQPFAQTPAALQAAPTLSPRAIAAQQQNSTSELTTAPISDPPGKQPAPLAKQALSQEQQPAAEPQSIVAKTKQFANAVIQRLSDYFEKKLPAPVLEEVQSIGKDMHRSGMKEAPIPTGPGQEQKQQLPARAPEPTQTPQRG
jgi:peptidoglycan hydrolase-like protein with peptidoglycan-binding domain